MIARPMTHHSGIAQLDCARLCTVAVIVLAFFIASGNAHWFWWAGLWPSLTISPLLLLLSFREDSMPPRIPLRSVPLLAALSGMAVVAGASAFAVDPSLLSIVQWVGTYLSPLLVYLGCQTTPFTRRLAASTWWAITLGALIPLLAGVLAYYKELWVPNALQLLTSRYDLVRMAGYMGATYGNTGNTAALLALLAPPWLAMLLNRGASRALHALCAFALIIAFVHILIVESRTLFVVLIVVLPLVAYFYRMRFAAAVGALLLVAGAVLLPLMSEGDRLLQLTFGAVQGTADDQSVAERSEAIRIGLKVMLDNPALGVGPGNSFKANMYTSAHQYLINQGEEIGVLGLVLIAAVSMAVFWRFVGLLRRRSRGGVDDIRFAGIAGATGYVLYGCIANMPLSATVVNVWVGLFAIMLAISDAHFTDAPLRPVQHTAA